jgi:hypothetical protein
MHAAAARKAVEVVAMAALRAIRNDAAMVSLEAVAKEAAKVVMRELREGVVARETKAGAWMYFDNAEAEESRVATAVVVAAGRTFTWLLIYGDETEVEDDEEVVEAERDAELRAVDVAIREAVAQRDAKLAARTSEERYARCRVENFAKSRVKVEAALAAVEAERVTTAEVKRVATAEAKRVATAEAKRVATAESVGREAAERATHWAAQMDKALTYRRDVDRREDCRCAQTEHRLERRQTVRCHDVAISTAMAAIDDTGNSDGAALL